MLEITSETVRSAPAIRKLRLRVEEFRTLSLPPAGRAENTAQLWMQSGGQASCFPSCGVTCQGTCGYLSECGCGTFNTCYLSCDGGAGSCYGTCNDTCANTCTCDTVCPPCG
jgi:hypothetical protein